jgi:hypothetical protein
LKEPESVKIKEIVEVDILSKRTKAR